VHYSMSAASEKETGLSLLSTIGKGTEHRVSRETHATLAHAACSRAPDNENHRVRACRTPCRSAKWEARRSRLNLPWLVCFGPFPAVPGRCSAPDDGQPALAIYAGAEVRLGRSSNSLVRSTFAAFMTVTSGAQRRVVELQIWQSAAAGFGRSRSVLLCSCSASNCSPRSSGGPSVCSTRAFSARRRLGAESAAGAQQLGKRTEGSRLS
jgi:hypothetical protein